MDSATKKVKSESADAASREEDPSQLSRSSCATSEEGSEHSAGSDNYEPRSMATSSRSNLSSQESIATEDDVQKIKDELEKNLDEEQMLLSLQMQLLMQLDKLNASVAAAESEERLATLALQQAQVTRIMKKTKNPDENVDDETITIQVRL